MRYVVSGKSLFLALLFFVFIAGLIHAQTATPPTLKRSQQSPNAAPGEGNGTPGLMRGPKMSGPPQPFPEAMAIAPPKNTEELKSATEELAHKLSAAGRFSGSVLLAVDGRAVVENGWGDADRKLKTTNTAETAYDVGSIGKLFTQIAILQLLDAGKLTLNDPFAKYLPDYPNHEISEKVTIRQLLLHTSGMGDFLDSVTPETNLSALRELKDFLPLFDQKPLAFPPGTQVQYSNAGYIVLGMVVEAAGGEEYYKYVERQILKPAGMTRSGFFDRTHLPSRVARSYDGGQDVTQMHPVRGSSAGGLQATVGDLWRLVQAINAGKLLKGESVQVLRDLIPHPPGASPPADATKLEAYGIAGGAPGVSAQLAVDPSGRFTRIVLCNSTPPMAMAMAATIGQWIKQMPTEGR